MSYHGAGRTGYEAPARPGEPLKGLSLAAATETSDLRTKVASLEGELKQRRESTQAVGEESRCGAWRRGPCARRPDHQPPVSCLPGFGGKAKGTTEEAGTDWPHHWVMPPPTQRGPSVCSTHPRAGLGAPLCG